MATYSIDEVMGKNTYTIDDVMGREPKQKPIPRTDKVLKGEADPFIAISQLVNKIPGVDYLQNQAARGVTKLLNPNLASDINSTPDKPLDSIVTDNENAYQQQRQAAGESGVDGYRLLGNIFNPANLAIASKLPVGVSLAGKVAKGATGGAALTAATQPVTGGDFWEEKGKQAAIGGAFGGALPLVVGGVARAISPNASKNANVALLKKEGVTPTIGQTLGGAWNSAEQKLQSVPILGDMITSARKTANSKLEKAAFNRSLAPVGKELPDGINGHEAVAFTENALKDSYDDVLTKIGAIKPDSQFNQAKAKLLGMVNKMLMPQAEKDKFLSVLDDVKQNIDTKSGMMTSESFKTLESSLGTSARTLGAEKNIYSNKLEPAVKQLQKELRDMLKRQAGTHADDLQKSNTAWANFKRVQNAAGKIGADEGRFTPAQLQNSVRALDGSKDKGAFARGNALMQDLSGAGKNVLNGTIPNSGTADRVMLGGAALGFGSAVNPIIPAALVGGAGLYTQPGLKLLNALVSARPESAKTFAELLRQNSNYILPAASSISAGLLN